MFQRACAMALVGLGVASTSHAVPNGIASSSCAGCHASDVNYDGTLALVANGELAPGVATSFTLRIEESHMKSAGFFVYSGEVGSFDAELGSRAQAGGLVHSTPAMAVDGVVEIDFSWTPPAEADGLDMWVYVVASDASGSPSGDIAASAAFPLVWGCDGIALYEDVDEDGYGNANGGRSIGCAARDGWAVADTDCNDLWASIHPDARETANGKDDDCNGAVDDGIAINTWYADRDADGFGDPGTETRSELAPEGYVANAEDCDDFDVAVSPNGIELCDGKDNDCNHLLDDGEGVYVVCGVGICSRRWETCDTECVPGTPMLEVCDGLDDDCDGEVDEDVTCPDGSACELGRCPAANALDDDTTVTSSPAPRADAGAAGPAGAESTETRSAEVPELDAGDGTYGANRDASAASALEETPHEAGHDEHPTVGTSRSADCSVSRGSKASWCWLVTGVLALARLRRSQRRNAR